MSIDDLWSTTYRPMLEKLSNSPQSATTARQMKVAVQEFKKHLKSQFKEVREKYGLIIEEWEELIQKSAPTADGKPAVNEDDLKIQKALEGVIVKETPNIKWDDVIGLKEVKEILKESLLLPILRPELFTGSIKPWKGILFYGPPGTGKTLLAKACASQIKDVTFYSVSLSDIMSRYVGESERTIKTLFAMARKDSSAVIFIDEIDSLAGDRSKGENNTAGIKTELLVQMDGMAGQGNRPTVICATNRPHDLDPAILRRLERRIYIPLPDLEARFELLRHSINTVNHSISSEELNDLAHKTQGYSAADLNVLVRDAAFQPLKICRIARKWKRVLIGKGQLQPEGVWWEPVPPSENLAVQTYAKCKLMELPEGKLRLPHVEYGHFLLALNRVKSSVDKSELAQYDKFTKQFGMRLGQK